MTPPAGPPHAAAPPATGGGRLRSVDVVRGLACVLMAIDHVRVYSGVPAGGPTPGVFFTRWVTHFVAPAFALFAGTGAYFLGRKLADPSRLAKFLASRGLLLVALELTVIRFFWTFSADYSTGVLAGVIWMLGWCMIILAAFVRLPARIVGTIGLLIVLLQQLFAFPGKLTGGAFATVWEFVYPGGHPPLSGVWILYVIVPWIGVMMAGYGFGTVFERDAAVRRRTFLRLGIGMTVLFLAIATALALRQDGDKLPPLFVRILNQQKYPASQLFLLMTLGPMIALLSWAEGAKGVVANAFETMGRVPMFYYLLHIPAIHLASVAVMAMRGASGVGGWYATAPSTQVPPEMRWGLGTLYLVYAVVLLLVLYPACRWYAGYKRRNPGGWRQYI